MNSLIFLAASAASYLGLSRRICLAPVRFLLMLPWVAAFNPLLGAELDYRGPAAMLATMEAVATRYPGICELVDYGDSHLKTTGAGGFDLMAMRITRREVPGPKPVFFLGGGIHGQEVSSGEIAMMFAEWLTEAYGHDPDATWVVDWHEIWVVPCLNPDGRQATTWHNARGVDLNRNFGFQWGLESGSNPGNRGPAPFSEPETQALRQLFLDLFPNAPGPVGTSPAPDHTSGLVIQLHSNGQQTFWPWGHTTEPPPNAADFAQFAMRLRQFDRYFVGQLGPDLFLVSGMLDDWVYGELGVPSFLRELLDPYYTVDPPYHVVVDEFWNHNQASLLHAAKLPRTPYLTVHGPEVRDLRVIHLGGTDFEVTAWIEDEISGNQAIAAAECYLGLPPWAPGAHSLALLPDDGMFNTPRELAGRRLSLDGWAPGRHLVFVRGQDAAGSWGPVSAAWVDVSQNQPPRIERVSPSSTTQMQCFTPQQFSVEAHDPEGDRLSYTWRLDGREWVSRGKPSVVYLPRAQDVGQRVLKVAVSDGGRVAHHSWRITVNADPRTVILGRGDPGTHWNGAWHSSRAWYPWSWASAFSFQESATYRWTPNLPQAGTYEVYAWWTYGRPSRATEAPYRIQHATGADTVFANQNDLNLTGRWNWLGTYDFLSGTSGYIELSAANGIVSADAVKLVLRETNDSPPLVAALPAVLRVFEGATANLTVTATGASPLAYQWRKNGVPIPGAIGPSLALRAAARHHAGTYDVVVSNSIRSVVSSPTRLMVMTRNGKEIDPGVPTRRRPGPERLPHPN